MEQIWSHSANSVSLSQKIHYQRKDWCVGMARITADFPPKFSFPNPTDCLHMWLHDLVVVVHSSAIQARQIEIHFSPPPKMPLHCGFVWNCCLCIKDEHSHMYMCVRQKMMRCDQITIFHYVNDRFLFCLDTYRGIRAKMICDANALEWC